MPIAFDRSVCCDLNETISREWLVTNGLGGYAAGTVAGTLTRMEQGLLVAPVRDEAVPRLLLAKIDEEVVFDQRTYYLGTNEYQDGTLNPAGFVHLETFHLEEGFPVFTYRLGGIDGIILEKRIWMPHGLNTTYIQYRVLRTVPPTTPAFRSINGRALQDEFTHNHGSPEAAQRVLTLTLLPFAAYRPAWEPQYGNLDWQFQVEAHQAEDALNGAPGAEDEQPLPFPFPKGVAGCSIRAWDGAHPYHIFAVGHPESSPTFIPTGVWYWHLLRRHDRAAGLAAHDDLYLPGVIRAKLWPGEDATLTMIVTAEELSSLTFSPVQLNLSYNRAIEHARSFLQPQRYFGEGGETTQTLPVLTFTPASDSQVEDEEFLRLLLQAADRFIGRRVLPRDDYAGARSPFFTGSEDVPVLIPGYYNMQDSIRDTLIALPGLTMATRRYVEAQRILRNLARHFRQGLLPDRLPAAGHPLEEQDYASVDTTLWYFYALDHYLRVTRDYQLLDDLYQRLVDSISWYIQGTYNGIQVDAQDGLVQAQQAGRALTWMNATANNTPVTPRHGKPVEVSALWYHALSLMHEWTQLLYQIGRIDHKSSAYEERSAAAKRSFNERFWYATGGYLYDVIDGPDGDDSSFRPNQLLALSLRYPILDEQYHSSVLELVSQRLVTAYGLRTLAREEAAYQGQLQENAQEQQRALHQGSVWPWLIGPYIDALRRQPDSAAAEMSEVRFAQAACEESEHVWNKGLQALEPFRKQLSLGLLGMIGSVYDGDAAVYEEAQAPYTMAQQVASALSIGEILRVYKLLAQIGISYPDPALSV